jgi:YHS domain-containing protein/multidrug efflux pump subunit AcrA (membrane-fusion protein)
MKKPLFAVSLLFLLMGSFLAGVYYNKGGNGSQSGAPGGRRVLYYVDPMNPAHTSDKPGVAPCGMAMEPVYDDEGSPGQAAGSAAMVMAPGTVKIPPQKQQVIGVQLGTVEVSSETHTVRTLGRVAADENLVYPLIAASDGWMGEVFGSTTGSMVMKDQVMAQLDVYTNDFYTWQQQYLVEVGYAERTRQTSIRQPPGWRPGSSRLSALPADAMPRDTTQPEAMPSDAMATGAMPQGETGQAGVQPAGPQPKASQQMPMPTETMLPGAMPQGQMDQTTAQPAGPQPKARPSGMQTHEGHEHAMVQAEDQPPSAPAPGARQSGTKLPTPKFSPGAYYLGNRAKLELLNLGLTENQLNELLRTGSYVSYVEIRSPVTGLVVARNTSPRQRVDKGTELFKVADLRRIWIVADIFTTEADYIRPGMRARVSLPRHQRSYEATVSEVPPQFDPATRSLKVRLEADNPDFELRPEMFVDVEFFITFPPAITVPAEAVLDSGRKKTVFVASGNGFFEPRRVVTGWRFGNRVEIVEGLMPGERIVISGNFLIDSESRMKLAAAGLFGTPEIDPVCGMDVYPAKAKPAGLTSEFEGKTYYFCEEACKAQFDKDHDPLNPNPAPGAKKPEAAPTAAVKRSAGITRDPVCRMVLHEGKARAAGLTSDYHGKTEYFCSEECKQEFEKDPQHFLQKDTGDKPPPAAAPGHGGHKHD